MKNSKFAVGDLVIYNSEIHEVVRIFEKNDEYKYELVLRAFIREMEVSEWQNQIIPYVSTKLESELKEFKHPKPKFNLGEKVKLADNDCVVRFIQFETYNYQYNVMSIDYYGPTGMGWKKEESYFSK